MIRLVNKKNAVWILLILIIMLFCILIFRSSKKIVEGFSERRFPLELRPQTGNIEINQRKGSGGNLLWMLGPSQMPDAMFNSVTAAIDRQRKIEDMFTNPQNYIRLDWRTQIPFTDVNINDIMTSTGNRCQPEYELKEIPTPPYMKGYKYFTVKTDFQINLIRRNCNIQVTPEMLGTLPTAIQNKWIDYIFNEQKNMISLKRKRIADSGGNCQTRRQFADQLFSPELRTAHENRIQQERAAAENTSLENIKEDINRTINELAIASGTTASDILSNTSTRSGLKVQLMQPTSNVRKAVFNQIRPSPYSVINTGLQAAGVNVLTDAFKRLINVLSGDPFAGTECPVGFTEIDRINTDPTFQKISEIFPNPFSDLINIGATTKACAKYEPGQPPIIQQKICRTEYVDEPTRLTAVQQTPTAPTCEMDRDITKKLQLVADWITQYSIENAARVIVVDNFSYVWAPSDYFLEAVFSISDYAKNLLNQTKDEYGRLTPTPEPDKREARFYFNKDNCSYSVFGYNNSNLDFLNQFRVNQGTNLDFRPSTSDAFLLWSYAVENNINNPIAYARNNRTNTTILNTVKTKKAEIDAREAADRKERDDLTKFLNPNNNENIGTSLRNAGLAELRERKQIFEQYPSINRNAVYTLASLRQTRDSEKEKFDIIAIFNPDKNSQVQAIYESKTLEFLQLLRTAGKQARDDAMRVLNPSNTLSRRLELETLQTSELQNLVREQNERNTLLTTLNPSNNPQTAAVLNQLDINSLRARYALWNDRREAITYFNPGDNEAINTRLLGMPVAELNERMTLVGRLNPRTNEEKQNLNLLTLNELRLRVDPDSVERQTFITFFGGDTNSTAKSNVEGMSIQDLRTRKNLIEQMKDRNVMATRQFWLNPTVPISDLQAQVNREKCTPPPGNDCWRPRFLRRNCPC